MNNRRIWFRLGGVLAAAAVCTGGAAVVSDRAQKAKNVQRAFLGAMETQMQIGCYPSETGSPADLTERERTELQTAYTSRVEQYYTEENPCRKRYIALNEDFLTACDSDVEYSESGGVADCIYAPPGDWKAYGDIGVLLGRAIAASPAFQGAGRFRGEETIRATVVGAGSHSTELSGSTIYYRDIAFPLKNLPILKLTGEEERGDAAALAQCIRDKLGWFADEGGLSPLALALRGEGNPSYARVDELARGIAGGLEPLRAQGIAPVVLVEADQAKVLGQAMAQRVEGPLLCLDSVGVDNGDYIDIGAPVAGGAVLPVVIKTLVFNKS